MFFEFGVVFFFNFICYVFAYSVVPWIIVISFNAAVVLSYFSGNLTD